MAKEYMFRGKNVDELKKFDTREFAKFLKARQRRAVLRQFQIIEQCVSRWNKQKDAGKPIRTHLRHLVIVPKMIDMQIAVHNGKLFNQIKIGHEMLGHRLGEFVPTRKKVEHGAPGIGATKSSAALSVK
jgi:small subunit ribosomal protein S19